MRKIKLTLGMSIDGYIATDEGSFDWISGDGDTSNNTTNKFDFNHYLETSDTIVMGKKAFDDSPLEMFSNHNIVVFTHQEIEDYENCTFVNEDLVKWIKFEKEKPGKDIYIFGGASVVTPLLETDLVDEYAIGIIPVILGGGRLLFKGKHAPIKLKLDQYVVDEGQAILFYSRRK